jgi:hypothetical protein
MRRVTKPVRKLDEVLDDIVRELGDARDEALSVPR